MFRHSLFLRYWATLATLATLPIVAAGLAETWFVYRSGYRSAIDRQVVEARQAAYQIERSVLPVLDRLSIIASVPWDYATSTADEQEKEMRRFARQFPLVARVQRVDAKGETIAAVTLDGQLRQLGPDERAAIASARLAGSTAPVVMRTGGEVPWAVAYVERGTGNALIADLRTDVMNDLVVRSERNPENLVFVADSAGMILAHPDLAPAYGSVQLEQLGPRRDAARLGLVLQPDAPREGSLGEIQTNVSLDPNRGSDWFAAYRRIDQLDWTVFALTPSAGLHADIRAAVVRTLVILVTANAVAVLLAVALARQMSRPLQSLADASQRVAHGDLSARADVLSDDHIGRVSRQFNAMVEQLHLSYAQLETRVAEKTIELEKANRHKSEFLAQMSHELRTPLNAVIGFSDALKARYFGPLNDKQLEYVRDIHASGQHLLSLINDLLDLAKIEAGRMDVSIGDVDIRKVADSALALVRGRAESRNIALRSSVDASITTWPADERKLKQILLNLLANAVKFTPDGGAVDLTVAPEPGDRPAALRFAVRDTGIGIPPDQVSRLFTDFGQIEQSGAGAREGTGLGLALSRRLVELHGGRIWAESEPGHGSTFHFTLPDRP